MVVGAGVVGLSSAYYLQERGFEVSVIDRNAKGSWNCSYVNGGMIVPSHFVPMAAPGMISTGLKMMLHPKSPFRIKPRLDFQLLGWLWRFARAANAAHVQRCTPVLVELHLRSKSLYRQLAKEPGADFELENRGLLALCKKQETLDHESSLAHRAQDLGMRADVLDSRQLSGLEPNIAMDVAGAVHYQDDAQLIPMRFMDWLRAKLTDKVEFIDEEEVPELRLEQGKVILGRRSSSQTSADVIVLSAGSWTGELCRQFGLNMPLQGGKGYSFLVDKPTELPSICALLAEARVAVTPMGGQLRFAGTLEIAGHDERIDTRRVRGIIESIPEYYPSYSTQMLECNTVSTGMRPCAPDGMPYIGKTDRARNVIVATGHGMMGMSMGPITGKLVAQIANGEVPEIDLDLCSPDRYA